MLSDLIERWSTSITVNTPTTTVSDEYNQYSYNTDSTIQGRLIEEEEIITFSENTGHGDKEISKARLYSTSELQYMTKVGEYHVFHKRVGKDNKNDTQFYIHFLK